MRERTATIRQNEYVLGARDLRVRRFWRGQSCFPGAQLVLDQLILKRRPRTGIQTMRFRGVPFA